MTKNGFSLIEMLVAIFIIALLSSIVVFNFSGLRGWLSLERAAHQMIQDLRVAQEMAISSRKLDESENCFSLPMRGYGVYIDISADNRSYNLYVDTAEDAGWEYYTSNDCIVKIINIQEKGVIIKEIKNIVGENQKVSINFKFPNPVINITGLPIGVNEVEIILALKAEQSKTKTVVVNRAGMIGIK